MIGSPGNRGASIEKPRARIDVPDGLLPARARFCDRVMQRAMALEMFRIDFNNGRSPQEALVGIIELAHKIAGVAETIGFPEAGQLAAALERITSDFAEGQAPLEEVWLSVEPQLVALIDELELIMDK